MPKRNTDKARLDFIEQVIIDNLRQGHASTYTLSAYLSASGPVFSNGQWSLRQSIDADIARAKEGKENV